MSKHDRYQDFFDYLERAPLRPDEIYGEQHPFSDLSDPIYNSKSLLLTEPEFDREPTLPLDAVTKLLTYYCYSPSASIRPSDLYRALALESEKTLLRSAPPAELLFFVLLHYLDFVYKTHKDTIIAQRFPPK